MSGFLARVARDRIGGEKPSVSRAMGAAAAVGSAAAAVTYRVLRR